MESSPDQRVRAQGFAPAAYRVLQHVQERMGLQMWVVGRRRDEEWSVLSSVGIDLGGRSVPWLATLCARVQGGFAGWATPDVEANPTLVDARDSLGLEFRSFVSLPLYGEDGTLLGTLCGAGTECLPEGFESHRPELEFLAGLLASQLAAEIRLEREAGHREVAETDAQTDALTGLGNRRRWELALAGEEARCRTSGGSAAVLTVDVDGLKIVNDRWGHEAGDVLLRQLADVLRRECRPGDTVSRLGGDEFAVLLTDTGQAQVELVAERLDAALRSAHVSASLGLAVRGGQGLAGAWRDADALMYAHKRLLAPRDPQRPPLQSTRLSQGEQSVVDELLTLVQRHMGADVAFIGRIEGLARVLRAVRSTKHIPLERGQSQPLEATYCQSMLTGELPHAVADTADNVVAAALPATASLPVGAYLGVPLRLVNGTSYGTLCCMSFTPNPSFDQHAVEFMESVAERLSFVLTAEETERDTRGRLLSAIDDVLTGGSAHVIYQPVVDLRTGDTYGLEALTRFDDHSRTTAQWFGDAASVERTAEIELRAARLALRESADWSADLWLKLSASVLISPAVDVLLAGCDLSRVVVEVSEHHPIDDLAFVRNVLAPWRERGLRLAIDGVGADITTLRDFLQLSPDLIKLEGSLLPDLPSSAGQRALLTALVTLAHEAKAEVVAVGVETAPQLEALKAVGVAYGQGYFLGAPAPAADHERRAMVAAPPALVMDRPTAPKVS